MFYSMTQPVFLCLALVGIGVIYISVDTAPAEQGRKRGRSR